MPKVPDHVTQETVGQKVVHGLNGWKGVFTGWYGGTYHMYDAQGSLDTIFSRCRPGRTEGRLQYP